MASPQQIQVNTENGRLGAGCKTEEGKAASARNATRHGLTSKTLVLADENQAEFDELLRQYARQYSPANPEQRFLVQQLAESDWRLRRARRLETSFFDQHTDEDILNNRQVAESLARLTRYETAIERSYYKALGAVRGQMKACQTEMTNALIGYINGPLPIRNGIESRVPTHGAAECTAQNTKRSEFGYPVATSRSKEYGTGSHGLDPRNDGRPAV